MANTIALAKNYVALLDEVYKNASTTTDFVGSPEMMRAGVNVNEICIPKIEVQGLGDYDRNSGYTDGTVSLEWETYKFNYDRGRKISVDSMDDEETFNTSFGMAGSELLRTKVAPEGDAFFYATLASKTGITAVTETIADGAAFLTALITATSALDEAEVPAENRYLRATPTLINAIMALDTTKSREVLATFANIVKVPQSRFYTAINLLDGKTSGEEAGHYTKATGATDINFMVIEKSAVVDFDKHVVGDIIQPANNPDSDAYILKYRKYGLVDVYANKVAGIYVSHK